MSLCALVHGIESSSTVFCISSPACPEESVKASVTQLVLFKVLHRKIKNVFFVFCAFEKYIICMKSIINLLWYSTRSLIVLAGY